MCALVTVLTFIAKEKIASNVAERTWLRVAYWAPHSAETDLCATVLRTGCIVEYNSLTPAHFVAEFWRQVVSCVRMCRGRGQAERSAWKYAIKSELRPVATNVRARVCVCVVASCRQSCHHRPRVGRAPRCGLLERP